MSISKSSLKRLRDNYLEMEVIVYLKNMSVVLPGEDNDITVNAMIQGIMLDADLDFIYVDNKAIKHDDYGMIELVDYQYDMLMDGIGPSDEKEIN